MAIATTTEAEAPAATRIAAGTRTTGRGAAADGRRAVIATGTVIATVIATAAALALLGSRRA